jgi:hypothetical protein
MQSVPITTNVVSSNPAQTRCICEYSRLIDLVEIIFSSVGRKAAFGVEFMVFDISTRRCNGGSSGMFRIWSISNVFMARNTPKMFAPPSPRRNFYECAPLTWNHGSVPDKYLCNQCLSLLTLWVRTPLRRDVFDTTLYDKVSDLQQVGGFLRVLWFPRPKKKTDRLQMYKHSILFRS